jgi:hypothetical protein
MFFLIGSAKPKERETLRGERMLSEELNSFLRVFFIIVLIALGLFAIFISVAIYKIRRIEVPADASFAGTLAVVPLSLVIALDLLDLSLDILAAPFCWVILDRLGLRALRGVSVVAALVPLTQPLPIMTVCWVIVRLGRKGVATLAGRKKLR